MTEAEVPEYINNVGEYLKTTGACGLLLHTSQEQSPYSDFDFSVVFRRVRERNRFVRRGKEHTDNISGVMQARLILNWINPYGGVNSMFEVGDDVVKIDINSETLQSIQRKNGILNSTVVYDDTGKLGEFLESKKEAIKRNFYSPTTDLQSLLPWQKASALLRAVMNASP